MNPTADISNDDGTMVAQGYDLVKDWHEGCTPGSDGCGFMNCPRFCENTDRATCFGDFVVPEVDTSGYYTFVWYWIFNPGSPYISCYEAYIDAEPVAEDDTDGVCLSMVSVGFVIPICMRICVDLYVMSCRLTSDCVCRCCILWWNSPLLTNHRDRITTDRP